MIVKRMCVALISVLTFACAALAGPYDVWARYRDIVINTTATGANVSGTVTNIPILLRLTNANSTTGKDVLDSALAGGADIRFASADGSTVIPYQIESWSSTAATIWVLVPSIAGNANTTIRMYWRNVEASSASSGSAVFSPSNGYSAVFHFAETGGGGTVFTDAARGYTTSTTGTANNITNPLIGANARTFSTGTGGTANTTAVTAWAAFTPDVSDPLRNLNGTTPVTLSAWVRSSITTSGNSAQGDKHIISHFTGTGTGSVWMRRRGGATNSDNNYANVNRYNAGGDTAVHQFGPMVPAGEGGTAIGNWHYITSVWNGTTWTVYRQRTTDAWNTPTVTSPPAHTTVDSVVIQTGVGPGAPTSNGNPWFLGTLSENGTMGGNMRRGWRGELDEVRISTVARSADYIRLSFETQKASANAVTLGSSAVQTPPFAYVATSRALVVGTASTPVAPIVGGTLASVSVAPSLPAGLVLDPLTGVISGTPTTSTPATNYVFTATLTGPDATIKDTIRIRTAVPVSGFAYADTNLMLGIAKVAAITAAYTGEVDSFTVTPALPTGLVLNSTTGAITGTPPGATPATNYNVTAHNPTGNITKVLRIRVVPLPTFSLTATSVTYEGGLAAPVTPIKPVTAVPVTAWSIAPPLPAGLSFNTTTGMISGTPTAAASATDYTITATNPAGTATASVNITVTAPETYGAWTQSKTFNINTSALAAVGMNQGQGHFPILVRLTAAHSAIFAAEATGNGIRFTRDGNRLAYEIDEWNSASNTAAVWVLVDTITASGITPIVMHYGNGSAVSKSNGLRVFTGAKGYVGVWHMGNPVGGNAQTGVRPNSGGTGAANNATPAQLASGWVTKSGIVGQADTLVATGLSRTNNVSGFGIGALPAGTFPDSNATFSGWVAFGYPGSQSLWRGVMSVASDSSTTNQNSIVVGSAGTGANRLGMQATNSGNPAWSSAANGTWTQNTWAYVVFSMKRGAPTDSLFKDGAYLPFSGTAGVKSVINDVDRTWNALGRHFGAGDSNITGKLDEMRISNVARSSDWVKLEYVSQKPGVTPVVDLAIAGSPFTFPEEVASTPTPAPTVMGTATRYSISPALPAGLTLNTATGIISGTPVDASAAKTYTVTAYGDSVWSTSTTISIAVTSAPPGNIAYATDSAVYKAGTVAITPNVPSNTGTITSWSVSPALPAGLVLHSGTGVISGEALAASPLTSYTVTGTGPDGTTTGTIKITVLPPSEDFSTWSYSRVITLNTTSTGANVSATVTNYPVLVRLGSAESAIFTQSVGDSGADIRFTKANGATRLPYEVVGWDAVSKTAEIWVKVDTLYGNNSTQSIKMYWGKPGVADSSSGSNVFGVSNGYSAVWHMGGTSGNEVDAASGRVATAVGSPLDTTGMVGRSRNFNGSNQHFAVANTVTGPLNYQMTDNYSFSAWVYVAGVPTTGGTGVVILNKGDNQYAFASYGTGEPKYWEIMTRGNNGHLKALSDGSNGTTVMTANGHIGSWRHIAGTYRGAPVGQAIAESLYIDGVLINTFAGTNSNNTGRDVNFNVHIGALAGGSAPGATFSRHFSGKIDEVRMASTVHSRDWVRLDYESQKTYQTLTNIGYQAPVIAYAVDSVNATAGFASETQLSINGTVTAPLTITPALPDGLTFNNATGSITGTPNVIYPSTIHTVTATNNGATAATTLVVTVVAPTLPGKAVVVAPVFGDATVSPTASKVVWNKVAPPVTNYRLQGSHDSTFATVILDTVVVDTSFGLSFAPYNSRVHVRVRANNIAGSGDWSDSVSFTTIIAPPVIAYTTPRSLIKGASDSLIVTSTGGPVASYAVTPDLPAGLTLNATTGRIDGTPTVAIAATNYTVTATNSTGTGTAVVSITVLDLTPVVSYTALVDSFTVNVAAARTPNSTGGSVTAWSITPALPAGLIFSTSTGSISGTPTAASAAANYTVIATNTYGKDTVILNIKVLPGLPVIAYAGTPKTFIKGVVDSLTVNSTGGVVASYAVAPALPAGLTLNTTTGRIGGTPTAASAAANYTVTATNASGTATATVNIQVQDLTPVVNYPALVDSFTVNIAATKTPTSTGGAVTAWTVTPALPAGLTLNATTGVISGTPTAASAAANYSVVAANAYGRDTVVLSLKVLLPTAIMGGAYTFQVSGFEKPYSFILPAGASATDMVTMSITDVRGRTVWTRSVHPHANGAATEVIWTGRTKTGMLASAGMYVVRVSVLNDGKVTEYVRKSVTLKSR